MKSDITDASSQKFTADARFKHSICRQPVPDESMVEILALARRRAPGVPLCRIVGFEEFLGSRYEVASGVIVPHPASELLVLVAADQIRKLRRPRVIEVGHGVGQAAIELARLCPSASITGSEVSSTARDVARRNADRILGDRCDRVEFVLAREHSDVLSPFAATPPVDIIVSNPPRLAVGDSVSDEIRLDTDDEALYGPDGTPDHFYRVFAEQGRRLLNERGAVVVEFSKSREWQMAHFEKNGWKVEIWDRQMRSALDTDGLLRPMTPTGHRVLVARPQ
ncbi:methyltransferase [Streptomyces sp. NBC_00347]|uniref:N5-glutamine methyltransferase family protein n=1 Tax=Streptomyces sp. NBC_00347 TaxID=2975721 RepID=UPI002257F3C3|nr:methyltransferase [Streptomyces sp. NBC_00347]MCX5126771.1 methyltransferase [Streptomyces sp. NBC_00347]